MLPTTFKTCHLTAMTPPHHSCSLWWPLKPGSYPQYFKDAGSLDIGPTTFQDLVRDRRDLVIVQRKLKNATNHVKDLSMDLPPTPCSFWWPLEPGCHPRYFTDPGGPDIGPNHVQDLVTDRKDLVIIQRKLKNAANHVRELSTDLPPTPCSLWWHLEPGNHPR